MSRARSQALVASAPLFAALGDETRLGIVGRLAQHGPQSISALSVHTAVTRQAVTKHLHALAAVGLVRDLRAGRERIWQLEPARLEDAREKLARIAEAWDGALARLAAFVEADEP